MQSVMQSVRLPTIIEDNGVKILHAPDLLSKTVSGIVIAAGFFDGVHLGHRRILATTVDLARSRGEQAWVLTFDPHPLAVVAPARRPPLLTSLNLRLEQLASTGVDGCLLLPFTPALAALSAKAFVDSVFGGWLAPDHRCTVVSGTNWRFGHDRVGDLLAIETLTGGGITVVNVPMMEIDGERVSSSSIRESVLRGDLVRAHTMLGRAYAVRARTVFGRGLGAKLGFATANMLPDADVLPPAGVYVVDARIRDRGTMQWMRGVANLGYCPTVETVRPKGSVLEVHILDYTENLHGAELDVRFLRRLREEITFPSLEALVGQIKRDVASAREMPGDRG